jgi:cytochrome c oxidase subunit 2
MPFNFPLQPPRASSFADQHDALFYTLCILTLLFTAIVAFGVIFFAIKYKKGSPADRSRPIYEDLRLELTWTIIPLIMGLGIFYWGASLFVTMRVPPKDAQEIYVIGKQWMWHVQHSNGVRENNTLHVPVGKPVKLTMISQDVIHAFYIPAFRAQMHVVPGRYTTMWFTATQAGKYHLFCSMYCGTQHSEMGGTVVALEPKEWAEWIANGGQSTVPMTLEQSGQKLYNSLACNNCHGVKDTVKGPSLMNIYNSRRRMSNGETVLADDAYLRESILRPHNRLTAGYGQEMPEYQGQITEEDVIKLVAFMKNLGMPTTGLPVSGTDREAAVTAGSKGSMSPLATNAIQYQQFSDREPDATATDRKKVLSVNAIAAQQGGAGN